MLEFISKFSIQLVDEVVTAVVGLLCVTALHNTNVELVDVGSQTNVDSLLKLGDVLLAPKFADDGQTGGLNVEDRFVDTFDIML